MRKFKYCICLLATAQLLFTTSCSLISKQSRTAAQPTVSATQTSTENYTVDKGTVTSSVSGTAKLVAASQTSIYLYMVSGVLTHLDVNENQLIKAGSVIAKIKSDSLLQQIEQQKYSIEQEQINYAQAKAEIEGQYLVISSDEKSLDNSLISCNQAQRQGSKSSSQDTADNLKIAQNNLFRAQLTLKADRNRLAELQSSKSIEAIRLESLQYQLNSLRNEATYCTLKANNSGYITYVNNASIGDYITAGTVMANLVEQKNMVLQFSSGDLTGYDEGRRVTVFLNGNKVSGTVYDPKPTDLIKSQDVGSGELKNTIYIKPDAPFDGMSINNTANVTVSTSSKNTLLVPLSTVRTQNSKYYVQVDQNGSYSSVEIKKGISSDAVVEVLSGIRKGDQIKKFN